MFENLKAPEVLLLLFVVLLLFGAKRLPDLAKAVGKSVKILKNEVNGHGDDDRPDGAAADIPPAADSVPPRPQPARSTPDRMTDA